MKARFGTGSAPGSARYLVNAGRLDHASWYLNEAAEGSRFVGEGGHFIDTLSWWFDAEPVQVYAVNGAAPDDVHATLLFDDGSVGTHRLRHDRQPARPEGDVRRVRPAAAAPASTTSTPRAVWTGRRRRSDRSPVRVDKGQRAELDAFVTAVRDGAPMPISLASLAATTRATLATARSLSTGSLEGW